MEIFLKNISWMAHNGMLAVLPVLYIFLFTKTRQKVLKIMWGILWLLFLPNSIYVITDLQHVIKQWGKVTGGEKILVLMQYGILEIVGLCAFILALYPVEKLLYSFFKKKTTFILIALNFFIGFAMVLGKVERINSWHVFTSPVDVIQGIVHILFDWKLLVLASLFGIFVNCFYFLMRKIVYGYFMRTLNRN